jgi:AcrR family transcriptional regulator
MTVASNIRSSALSRGHKKRSRTLQALLDAALEVLAESGEGFSIGEVATRANVSHGTFYNYFRDRDELLNALIPYFLQKFAAQAELAVNATDQAVRFATISARALRAAEESPHLVRLALRIDAFQRALLTEGPLSHLHANLVDGYRAGRFTPEPNDGTLDVILGALLLAARRAVDGESDDGHRVSVLQRLLMSLGIDGAEAHDIATTAVRR